MNELVSKWREVTKRRYHDLRDEVDFLDVVLAGNDMADLIEKQDRLLGLYREYMNETRYEIRQDIRDKIKQEESR